MKNVLVVLLLFIFFLLAQFLNVVSGGYILVSTGDVVKGDFNEPVILPNCYQWYPRVGSEVFFSQPVLFFYRSVLAQDFMIFNEFGGLIGKPIEFRFHPDKGYSVW